MNKKYRGGEWGGGEIISQHSQMLSHQFLCIDIECSLSILDIYKQREGHKCSVSCLKKICFISILFFF